MLNFLETINNNLNMILTIIGTLTAIAVAVAVAIRKVKQEWEAEKKLMPIANELMATVENNPLAVISQLAEKPALIESPAIHSNFGKQNIVAQALLEREPKLLKKMKLKDIIQVGEWVSGAYSIIKPIVKTLKK